MKTKRTLAERGRMLTADDIVALLPRKSDGKTPIKSRYWVMNDFLIEKRQKLGRTVFWWEADVLEALDTGAVAA